MPVLYLIRHGKASAGTDDYDRLHEIGVRQADLLGEHFARQGLVFDAIYAGPLKRHRQTLQHMTRAPLARGLGWPEAQELSELSEGPYEELVRHMVLTRAGHDAHLTGLLQALRDAGTDAERMKPLIVQMLNHMNGLWHAGELHVEGRETAAQFLARVASGLRRIVQEQAGAARVAVVTSNGVIGGMLDDALGTRHMAAGLPMFRNSSVTLLQSTPAGLSLLERDLTEHLTDPGHLTLI